MKIQISTYSGCELIRTLVPHLTYISLFILLPFFSFAQPGNDLCTNATTLTPAGVCNNTAGTANNATVTGGDPGSGTCGGTVRYDVWYRFTAPTTTATITLSGTGAQFQNPRIQILSGTCGSLSIMSCSASPLNATGLTVGTTYYIRVFSTTNPIPVAAGGFNICLTIPTPSNDNCAGSVLLTEGATCSFTFGTLLGSTNSGIAIGPCSGTPDDDVWYRFVATSTRPTIRVDNIGQNLWNLGGPRMQLFSGTCGTLTSIACGGPNTMSPTGLTIGSTYYIRVYSLNSGPAPGGTAALAGFDICVTDPQPADIDYSKSYVNITKGQGGGTVAPGDTLEIRATIVVSSQTIDSVAYFDTLFRTRGLRLIPNSISLRTNEGKLYTSFTDVIDTDAGRAISFGAGPDTAIRMNIGLGATSTARGKLRSISKPSFYDRVCIMMATYRVVVYAGYNTKINFGGGAFTYVDSATAAVITVPFKRDSIIVYQSPGLCPNAVSATNAIGVESNGTFGAPSGPAPLARNRGASAFVPGYSYRAFSVSSGPDDYHYGITNNTSARYTTLTNWNKPDPNNPKYRQFDKWDITGDHTGAANPNTGNSPCDTTQPVSASNPCGYMLVINSSFKTDTAFQYSVTNLCPDTYYELSAWIKNMCYFCGCDSNGNPAENGAYLPSGPGDSSGVQPNLAFEINGVDYFTTGNLRYIGTTPTGSDASNRWVKKGFVYRTGPSETSFVLGIRNNAPGGGGNDWAIDDITLATCIPEMNYYPSSIANVCRQNATTIYDTVSSFYSNYVYYKWQRSTNGGASWSDVSAPQGPATPVYNASAGAWQYMTHLVIHPANTDTPNDNDLYRVVAATTSPNLSTSNCITTDGVSFLTLNVMNCGTPLKTDLLSFNGQLVNDQASLSWTTTEEEEPVKYNVERSADGSSFSVIGTIDGYNNGSSLNRYSFTDPLIVNGKTFYRIAITDNAGRTKMSRIIRLSRESLVFALSNVVNPFNNELLFDITTSESKTVKITLLDMHGKTMKKLDYTVYEGVNSIRIENIKNLQPGMYILQVQDKENILVEKIVRK
jgi:trimeric autotransporter adhesin